MMNMRKNVGGRTRAGGGEERKRTPEERHDAYDEDSEVVWYDCKVDELGGDEYAPTIGMVS